MVLLKKGGERQLDLKTVGGKYTVKWYDPRNGGDLQDGSVQSISGEGAQSLGTSPDNPDKDWVVLVRRN